MTLFEHFERLCQKLVIIERGWLIVALLAWCMSVVGAGYFGYVWGRR